MNKWEEIQQTHTMTLEKFLEKSRADIRYYRRVEKSIIESI